MSVFYESRCNRAGHLGLTTSKHLPVYFGHEVEQHAHVEGVEFILSKSAPLWNGIQCHQGLALQGSTPRTKNSPVTPPTNTTAKTIRQEDHTLILAYGPVHLQGIQDHTRRQDTWFKPGYILTTLAKKESWWPWIRLHEWARRAVYQFFCLWSPSHRWKHFFPQTLSQSRVNLSGWTKKSRRI